MKRKKILILISIIISLYLNPTPVFADLEEDLENMYFEFIYPQDKDIIIIEDCTLTIHRDHALILTYESDFSSSIKLMLTSWEPDSEQRGIYTYRKHDHTYKQLKWSNLTTTTYAFKAEPVDPETNEILADGWQITYDVVCLDELEEEEREIYLNTSEPEPKQITEKEHKDEKTKKTSIIEQEELVKETQSKGLKKIIKEITAIITDIRDIFTWNISFAEIDWNAFLPEEKTEDLQKKKDTIKKKPFGFPFEKIIGVTQWYGNTAYQKPHTGIDFGATKETIISPGDGEVVALGWDNFNGECFSGGNYLVLKHNNDMHTAYFHIEKYFVKLGDSVKKGDKIAISGNSGKWNCQNLGYHLHFETRLGRYQETHDNPVDYIDTDWDKVPTLGYKYNPGRLSGENPHPTY